jgi:hypothetical protein
MCLRLVVLFHTGIVHNQISLRCLPHPMTRAAVPWLDGMTVGFAKNAIRHLPQNA